MKREMWGFCSVTVESKMKMWKMHKLCEQSAGSPCPELTLSMGRGSTFSDGQSYIVATSEL